MANYIIPKKQNVKKLLVGIFGDGTEVEDGEALNLDESFVANYVLEDNTVAVCVADVSLVVNSGSGMMQLPPGVAQDAIKENDPTGIMVEAYYEVANILTRVLMNAKTPHLKLTNLAKPGEDIGFAAGLNGSAECVPFKVEIPGFGSGNLTFLVT